MKVQEKNRFDAAEKVIIITGILLIILSFVSEINFHYFQGFTLDSVDNDIFWRAEASEVFNSMSFLVLGRTLIAIAFILSKKRKNL
ncbi:MAG: hypothetical protein ACW99E_20210 [Promethearchaeota archaeon]